jgi:hypothetical protein
MPSLLTGKKKRKAHTHAFEEKTHRAEGWKKESWHAGGSLEG